MSSTDSDTTDVEQLDRKIEALAGVVPEGRLAELRQQRAEAAGETDPDDDPDPTETDVDVVEALSSVDEATLSDPDAIDEEITRREQKLDVVGVVLPDDRVADVHDEIEALQAAKEVTSPYRTNTPEALAARIEVRNQ